MKKNNILKIIIIVVVLLIPIIYSFFYLKSYWDPYKDLSGINLAIVNLDEGKGKENEGKELLSELEKDDTFSISAVTLDEANIGIQNGSYYATIIIPSNFTECLNSASSTNKQISTITYSPNQASNYLASQIINSAVKEIEINLRAKIDSKIAENLADNLKQVPDELNKISDGSNQILTGSKSLGSGISKLNSGTTKLKENYTAFNNGIMSASNGSNLLKNGLSKANSGIYSLKSGSTSLSNAISQINNGANELSQKSIVGIEQLQKGIKQINKGTTTLNSNIISYTDGVTNIANGTINYIQGTDTLTKKVNTYIDSVDKTNQNINALLKAVSKLDNSSDPTSKALAKQAQAIINSNVIDSITNGGENIKKGQDKLTSSNKTLTTGAKKIIDSGNKLKQGSKTLSSGSNTLEKNTDSLTGITTGIKTLESSLNKLQVGSTSLQSGINVLDSGFNDLQSGSSNLSDGLYVLTNSSSQIKSALNTLNNGTMSAVTGSNHLISGIEKFNSEINNGITDTNKDLKKLNNIEDYAQEPVKFETKAYGKVDSYGIAFTPLFLCIGLWVGALMCYVVLYYDQNHRFGMLDSTYKNKFLQNLLYICLGAFQGIVIGFLLKFGLHLEIQNTHLYYGCCILISISFMCIIQFLIRNFGDVGKLIALIILVLQLAASGGTFPVETIDKGFQAFTPFLPMTYSIKLLKEVLVPTATNFRPQYILILIGITLGTLLITYIVDIIRYKKNISQNKPLKNNKHT